MHIISLVAATSIAQAQQETAIFAGGCFWCMEEPFDKIDGVISTTSGYTAGHTMNPAYEDVSTGESGHTEAVQVIFNTEKVSYSDLLNTYWVNIDPIAINEQFCDFGTQYRSGIYFLNKAQEIAARQSLQNLQTTKFTDNSIATEILPASTFYPAEGYHQNYYLNNPVFYKIIRFTCGRDRRLEKLWGIQ